MTQLRIDMHSHFYGANLPAMLRARGEYPRLRTLPNGSDSMLAMNGEFPFSAAYHDPEIGLAQMDAAGITHRMITFPGALGVDLLPVKTAPAISTFNTHLAKLGTDSHGRLIGLAGLRCRRTIRNTAPLRWTCKARSHKPC